MVKKLDIYVEESLYVIERIDQFGHPTKRFFETTDGLKEGLYACGSVIDEYEINVSENLWPFIINALNNRDF